ncbi:hypothetical protein ITQ94_08630 [Pediococcus pentosaceus]|uniref:hypothetical protein n=1 Tax=Pediococcus pentosaceus TaxID=1255 RepID=UPI0018FE7FC4|nr:hypothetical protein [Pediococcus pentosaceus]MBF7131501.1 hypothetical protein [Pediococcus pentosaceus]
MSRKLTKEEFINREPDILDGGYEFIGEYINATTKTLFKHNTCEYEWMITPDKFHTGNRCPKCAGNIKLTKEEFCKREEDIQSGEYLIVGVYKNTQTKVLIKHNVCGYEWMIRPCIFHQGNRCPRCAGNIKLTKEEFCDREEDIKSSEYEIVSRYVDTNTKTLLKHTICGYEWMIMPRIFHQGERCPRCKQSKGENKVSSVLENIAVTFEAQKRFNSCKYKKPLPFDFYVNDSFLIEYDGEQHFKPVDFSGKGAEWAIKNYELGKLRDNIKTQWAKDNGIPLVRIPYTEFDNIEQIIEDNIEKYSIQKAG